MQEPNTYNIILNQYDLDGIIAGDIKYIIRPVNGYKIGDRIKICDDSDCINVIITHINYDSTAGIEDNFCIISFELVGDV
jgi:hypothetical protein